MACGAEAPAKAGKPKPQFAGPPPMTIDTKATYTATMVTSCGTIVIELDAKRAPQTVNSFVFLAEKGYFDGQYFHRLDTSIDVIQGGDPSGTGSDGPGYAIPDELNGKLTYTPGTIAMANAGANTGGSQFFIITGPERHQSRREPELHDLREDRRGARRRSGHPGVADRGPERNGSVRSAPEARRVPREGDDRGEWRGHVARRVAQLPPGSASQASMPFEDLAT